MTWGTPAETQDGEPVRGGGNLQRDMIQNQSEAELGDTCTCRDKIQNHSTGSVDSSASSAGPG